MRRLLVGLGIAALLSPLAALACFELAPGRDVVVSSRQLHFWAVGITAISAAVACAMVVASARSLRETRLLFLALAFIAIGGIFSVHGLLTPGVVVKDFHTPLVVSSWVSILVGSALVALSAVRLPQAAERFVQHAGGAVFAWAVVAVAAYIFLSFTAHGWLDWAPTDHSSVQYALMLSSTAMFSFGALRYAQAYQFARLPSQGAMVVALVLLAQVPCILLWGETWHLSWWMYHVVYGMAFVVLFAGWAVEVRRAGSLKVIAEALSMRDALAQLNRGHDTHVLELVDAIEAKDRATLGHVRRVSAYALDIGRRLGLSQAELRSLALAAEMHDVGKIGVPDAILSKPGKLTDEEFREMQRHTARGSDIARRIHALREVAPVIRAHHERLNGRGYPDGLRGDEIPLLARIIAVADTFDAMTSHRPYRPAMTRDAAILELRRVRGFELDAHCVDAFLASLDQSTLAAA
jgi:HD-GYP domain-containing protein (c-di-GMP phosphodiesterase class II)